MCTFEGERAVLVCDVAIDQVRAELAGYLGEQVTYRAANEGRATLVEAPPAVDPQVFAQAVRRGMDRAALARTGEPMPVRPLTIEKRPGDTGL
ncbi:MAG TPA: hypothetical protein VFW71_14410 [Actinomycetota bacterium]|nr:hypothetical protein [Actinomycetota bacterium]